MTRRLSPLLLGTAALALASCGAKTPSGQVVADVNGDEITRRDITTELGQSGLGTGVDMKTVQPALVERLVNRKLLVEQAKRDGLDKTPEYLAAEQRAKEILLASNLIEQWASKLGDPTDADLQAFITENPQMFANRRALQIDQLVTSAQGIDPKKLVPLTSNDQLAALLTSMQHPFKRGNVTIDTATLPKKMADQIAGLPAGMPFVFNRAGTLLMNAVIGSRDLPLPEADRKTVAVNALKQRNAGDAVSNQIKSLRASAKIEYQRGFAPPATPAKAP